MANVVVTVALDQPLPYRLEGDNVVISGELQTDTGDYTAGGTALAASSLLMDSIDRVIFGGPNAAGLRAYWVKSTGKWKVFDEDDTSGIEAEHAASAMLAKNYPFIAFGRKAS